MAMELNEQEHAVLSLLSRHAGSPTVGDVAQKTGLDQAQVAAVAHTAKQRGWIDVTEKKRSELSLAPGAGELIAQGLPERRFLDRMPPGQPLSMRDAAGLARELGTALNEVLRYGGQRGWFRKAGGELHLTDEGKAAAGKPAPDERALQIVAERGPIFLDELEGLGVSEGAAAKLLAKRGNVAKTKVRTFRTLALTPVGREILSGELIVKRLRSQLTSEDLTTGGWRRIELKPYDVTLAAETAVPVKSHPFQRILEQTRRAFLEMGFTEMVSPMVETAFWDFDALFQPQDHPARDMQDTFYLARPATGRLPASELVERVKRTHEDGGDTGSLGWGYRWSEDRARRMVLRTHTTATTVRALAADPNPPRKVFCVGRVFRNETITYKHLPEFTQVDGIIIDKKANFAMLLAVLKEFYRKMGFQRVKFKPAFFPYTEPSAEVFVWMDSKKTWIELGGSGVFRPEVTKPLGCDVPVLAWGLGLERLAMQRYGLGDIRTLYWTDLDWLREVPLCQ